MVRRGVRNAVLPLMRVVYLMDVVVGASLELEARAILTRLCTLGHMFKVTGCCMTIAPPLDLEFMAAKCSCVKLARPVTCRIIVIIALHRPWVKPFPGAVLALEAEAFNSDIRSRLREVTDLDSVNLCCRRSWPRGHHQERRAQGHGANGGREGSSQCTDASVDMFEVLHKSSLLGLGLTIRSD